MRRRGWTRPAARRISAGHTRKEPALSARVRKLIGLVLMLAFIAGYVWLATVIADRLPDHWAAKLAFYVVVGTGWGIPILPLISWMNRGR